MNISSTQVLTEINPVNTTKISGTCALVEVLITDSLLSYTQTLVEVEPEKNTKVSNSQSLVEVAFRKSKISSLLTLIEVSEYIPPIPQESIIQYRKFLASVADVWGYSEETGELLFTGKTLLDSSLDFSVSTTDVYSGRDSLLETIYTNSPQLKITINDAQFNLSLLSLNTQNGITTSNNIYTDERVILGVGGIGTVRNNPVATTDTNIYGWVTINDSTEKVVFSGKNFTCSGLLGQEVCIRYYTLSENTQSIEIDGEIIPSTVRLVMEAMLVSSDSSSNQIGKIQITFPRAEFGGSFSLSIKPEGYTSTPVELNILASQANNGDYVFGDIIEIIENSEWYSEISQIVIANGDFYIPITETKYIDLKAIGNMTVFSPPYSDITFSSSNTSVGTISSSGYFTALSTGTTTITAKVSAYTRFTDSIIITVY